MMFLASHTFAGTWEPVGPTGGYIRALASGPDNAVYAGTDFGGVYRTTDDGLLWEQMFDFTLINQSVSIRSLAVDDDGDLLAGTDGFGLLVYDGLNYYRLSTPTAVLTRKLLLIR